MRNRMIHDKYEVSKNLDSLLRYVRNVECLAGFSFRRTRSRMWNARDTWQHAYQRPSTRIELTTPSQNALKNLTTTLFVKKDSNRPTAATISIQQYDGVLELANAGWGLSQLEQYKHLLANRNPRKIYCGFQISDEGARFRLVARTWNKHSSVLCVKTKSSHEIAFCAFAAARTIDLTLCCASALELLPIL